MPRFFIVGILLFLLLGVGYGPAQAARYIPWDCSDWQAFAHADRDTAILESLAENRGKTLYCGIDQSDTFAKAETWAAGKDRNERDGTVYWGERGSFRGFIAAQEGWLTDGESGITGQSIAHIFEFPKKEKKRRWKTVVIEKEEVPAAPSRLVPSPPGDSLTGINLSTRAVAERTSRSWFFVNPPAFDRAQLVRTAAREHCRSLGYSRAVKAAAVPFTHTVDDPQGWDYTEDLDPRPNYWTFAAYQTSQWTAVCQKTKRVRR